MPDHISEARATRALRQQLIRRRNTVWPLLVGMLLVLAQGCGFHLRGSRIDGLNLPPVIVSGPAGSEVVRQLKDYLRVAGVTLVDDVAAAGLVAIIGDELRERRVLSVGGKGKVEEYELRYAVNFSAQDPSGKLLLAQQTISLVRGYSFQETDVIAKNTEEDQLYEAMRIDAVREIALRMRVLTVSD